MSDTALILAAASPFAFAALLIVANAMIGLAEGNRNRAMRAERRRRRASSGA